MQFLDGTSLGLALPGLVNGSSAVRLCVAFWGKGALEGCQGPLNRLKIVCNLRMGGTNPGTIRKLQEAGAQVRHHDTLHSKVYLFDTCGVVGSSNASANGLSFQGNAAAGWVEANVMFDENTPLYADAARQFEAVWEKADEVTDKDLQVAEEAWSRRRRGELPRVAKGQDLLSALTEDPSAFEGRRIFLVVDTQDLSKKAKAAVKKLKAQRKTTGEGEELGAWEDWADMPKLATLVNFFRGPRGGLTFTGFWLSPEVPMDHGILGGGTLQIVHQVDAVEGCTEPGLIASWKAGVEAWWNSEPKDANDGETYWLDLGQFANDYLLKVPNAD